MPERERKKPGRKPLPIDKRKVMLSVRMPPGELELLHREAQSRGVTASEFIREAVSDWLKREATHG